LTDAAQRTKGRFSNIQSGLARFGIWTIISVYLGSLRSRKGGVDLRQHTHKSFSLQCERQKANLSSRQLYLRIFHIFCKRKNTVKLRFRLMIEGADNTPLANTRVRLIANKGSVELILAEVATNAYGYGIVDVPDLGKEEEIGLRVTGKWVHEVAEYMFHPKFAVEMAVPKDVAALATTCHTLDWHSEPLDIEDVVAIPSSFPDLGLAMAIAGGFCRAIGYRNIRK
jgi:hypothetical protein